MDKEHNHNVYVSGLPDDITIEEFAELMSKYGIIMENEEGVVWDEEGVAVGVSGILWCEGVRGMG